MIRRLPTTSSVVLRNLHRIVLMACNEPSLVGRPDLEHQLDSIRAAAAGHNEGLFGNRSLLWRVDREAALFLGAGRALLLQLAHPWVAAGIAEHSSTFADPIGRFHRTFSTVFTMVFGSLDQALAAARRLHLRHAAVQGELPEATGSFTTGSLYCANEVSALQWVHATLVETALIAHDLVLPPLSSEERELYYADSRHLGALFGIPPNRQPADWSAFTAYNEAMWQSELLTVSPAARAIAKQVLSGAGTWLRVPAWYRALTASMLPPRLRTGFGLPYEDPERRSAERALTWIEHIYPALPFRIRYVGPYQEARQRLAGRVRPDLTARCVNRLWIGRPSMSRATGGRHRP